LLIIVPAPSLVLLAKSLAPLVTEFVASLIDDGSSVLEHDLTITVAHVPIKNKKTQTSR